jgi:hypothetical protein
MECPGANIPLPGNDSQIERTTHRRYRRAGERHTASAAAGLNSVRLVRETFGPKWRGKSTLEAFSALIG